MKILLIFFIYSTYLFSHSLVKLPNNIEWCVSDSWSYTNNYYIFYKLPDYISTPSIPASAVISITGGYSFNVETNSCEKDTDKFLGMKEEDFNFAMAIYGVALSSLIGFGLVRSIS